MFRSEKFHSGTFLIIFRFVPHYVSLNSQNAIPHTSLLLQTYFLEKKHVIYEKEKNEFFWKRVSSKNELFPDIRTCPATRSSTWLCTKPNLPSARGRLLPSFLSQKFVSFFCWKKIILGNWSLNPNYLCSTNTGCSNRVLSMFRYNLIFFTS